MKNIYYSGRSSDYIAPSFVTNCSSVCVYCYAHRRGFEIKVQDINNVISQIDDYQLDRKIIKPNQTHDNFITWDIGCDSDISRDYIDYPEEVEQLLHYFTSHPSYFGTFATKTMNRKILNFNAQNKIRMRISLMPHKISKIVESKVSPISRRISFIPEVLQSSFELHYNFSPVIVYKGWLKDWEELLKQIPPLPCEVIFLTHNKRFHERNLEHGLKLQESLLWNPELQEEKISSYGSKNVRYKSKYKRGWINKFVYLLNKYKFKIRYIF